MRGQSKDKPEKCHVPLLPELPGTACRSGSALSARLTGRRIPSRPPTRTALRSVVIGSEAWTVPGISPPADGPRGSGVAEAAT